MIRMPRSGDYRGLLQARQTENHRKSGNDGRSSAEKRTERPPRAPELTIGPEYDLSCRRAPDPFGYLAALHAADVPAKNSDIPVTAAEGALLSVLPNVVSAATPDKPNVLLVMTDDQGYGDFSLHGNPLLETPHLDRFAREGVRFLNFQVSPFCSPTRASLVTGRYSLRTGVTSVTHCKEVMRHTEVTLAEALRPAGYTSACIGKWHNGEQFPHTALGQGFDEFYGFNGGHYVTYFDPVLLRGTKPEQASGFITDILAGEAIDFMRRNREHPFFCYLPFNAVHSPHEAPDKYLKRFAHISDPRRRQFDGMLSAMDDAVGQVLGKLRELKLEENTLIFFISDNGAPGGRDGNGVLRGGKHTCWEGGFRLPWLVQWKGKLPAGKVEDRPVSQLDVLPTCVAAAGGSVDPAWQLDGVNLLPYLTGENKERPHQTLFWRIDGMWAIRDGDLKLVVGDPGQAPELFDLAADLGEKDDLAARQPAEVKELQAMWDLWNAQMAPPSPPKDKATKKTKTRKRKP